MKDIIMSVLVAYAAFACESKTEIKSKNRGTLDDVTRAISESNAIYFQAFEKNDSSIFFERYADDGCIMAPNTPPMCGRKAVTDFFKTAYHDYGLRSGKFITTAIYGDGQEFVTEEGLWQSYDAKGNLFDNGKFLVLWKNTNKGSKMYRDSFSSNRNN